MLDKAPSFLHTYFMKNLYIAAALCSVLFLGVFFVSCEELLGGGAEEKGLFSNAEAVQALRDALSEGTASACNILSAEDGFFGNQALKILLPPDAKPVMDNIGKIPGGQKLIDDVVLRLNRSAEKAAKGAGTIFLKAITDMTVTDGIAIVRGDDTAATEYLKKETYNNLVLLFKPVVSGALNEKLVLNISANDSWETLCSAYDTAKDINNALPLRDPMPDITSDLAQYATEKALDGLFIKIAEEEQEIRKNPMDYASAIIKKVFGALLQK